MELVTVRELFKNREQYLDKKVTVGGMDPQYSRFQDIWIYRGK
mgnify:FL=1